MDATCDRQSGGEQVERGGLISSAQAAQYAIEEEIRSARPSSFQARLLKKLAERNQVVLGSERREMVAMTEKRRRSLVSEGVLDTQEAQVYVTDAVSELPDHVQERRMANIAAEQAEKRRCEQIRRQEEACKAYQDRWLVAKENELYRLMEKKQRILGSSELASALENLMKISEDKMRQFHELRGTVTNETLKERRKFCISKGYVDENFAHLIQNVYERMPLSTAPTPPWTETEEDVGPAPKTPSWSPRPDRTPLRSWFFSPRTPHVRAEPEPDLSRPPKTPSYTRPPKRRVEVTEISQERRTKKRSIVDYFH